MLLIYLLAVVVIAVVGDVVPALLAAVASFLLVNWFLTPTYYTLAVESRDAAIDLVVFVLAASRSASASSWAPETAQQLSARGSSRG
jgi:two-component system, OmpR family, sensor histidine kinase KdpD